MAATTVKRRSFSAAELSEALYVRDDLARWHIGVARCEGFYPLLEGGLARTPGTRFVKPLLNEAQAGRMLKFSYSTTDNYLLLINGGQMQLIRGEGFVLDAAQPDGMFRLATPWTAAQLPSLHAQQVENQIFVAADTVEPRAITRVGPADWTIAPYRPLGGPVETQNLDVAKTIRASALTGTGITLTGAGTDFSALDVNGVYRLDEQDLGNVFVWQANETIVSASTQISLAGATAIGDMTLNTGLAASFNGVRGEFLAACSVKAGDAGFVGQNFAAAPKRVAKAIVHGSGDKGFSTAAGIGTAVLRLYGKNGAAPANYLDGTQLGEFKFINTSDESAGRTVYSLDPATLWQYVWISVIYQGGDGNVVCSELRLFAPDAAAPATQRRFNGRVYLALNDGDTGAIPPTHDTGDVATGRFNIKWRFVNNGYGIVRITAVASALSATADVLSPLPASLLTGTYRWWPPGWSSRVGWPTHVAQHDQRLLFWRTATFWLTRPSDINSLELLTFIDAVNADSALAVRLKARRNRVPVIEWAFSVNILLLGLADGERIIRSPNEFDALTIDKLRTLPTSNEGSASQQDPVDIDDGVIFIGGSRRRLHFTRYSPLSSQLDTSEITLSARHILKGGARRSVWQRDPDRLIWVMLDSGELRGCTFMIKEEINGFFRRPFGNGDHGVITAPALCRDIAETLSEDGARNLVYLLMERRVNGAQRRFAELMAPAFEPVDALAPTALGAWYVDCGLRYSGPAVAQVGGFEHLEGREVALLVDGAQQSPKVVTAGMVMLDPPCKAGGEVISGIAQAGFIRSLPINFDTQGGSSNGKIKKISHVILTLVNAMGGQVRVNEGPWEEIFGTGDLDYGTPPKLFSGTRRIAVEHSVKDGDELTCVIEIRNDSVYPFTLTGWDYDLTVEPG